MIQRDIDEGRDALNFSEVDREQEADEAAEVVADGEMPSGRYTLINPDARLSDAEREQLVRGLEATFGSGGGDNGGPG